jgi:hypothetical protein
MSNPSSGMDPSHGFLMLGTGRLFSCHLPMFFDPKHSFQTILEIGLEGADMETYLKVKNENPSKPLIIMNDDLMPLEKLVNSSSFLADAFLQTKTVTH